MKNALERMQLIFLAGKAYKGKKERGWKSVALAYKPTVTFNNCSVILPDIIRETAHYFTILPTWSYKLKSDNAVMLLDYIYYLARQRTADIREKGHFTISLEGIRARLGLPTPQEVKESHARQYTLYIINPIEAAITAIEDGQEGDDLKITPIYDAAYKNVHEYLDGYLEITMTGETRAYMMDRAKNEATEKAKAKRLEDKKQIAAATRKAKKEGEE
jgi:hypothetical protein